MCTYLCILYIYILYTHVCVCVSVSPGRGGEGRFEARVVALGMDLLPELSCSVTLEKNEPFWGKTIFSDFSGGKRVPLNN